MALEDEDHVEIQRDDEQEPSFVVLPDSLERAIEILRAEVITMAKVARRQLEQSVKGLLHNDLDACNSVIADDELVDQYEKSIGEIAMEILNTFRPVSGQMRVVVTSMNVARSLERIADHAVTIARRSRKIMKRGELSERGLIEPLYTSATSQLVDALSAYADRNATQAAAIVERDKILDKSYKKASKALSRMLEMQHEDCAGLLHLLFVARALERVGDLSANIGEDVVFIESAEDIRHSHG